MDRRRIQDWTVVSVLANARRLLAFLFADREVLIRDRGQVRFAALTGFHQVLLAGALVAVVGWIGITTWSWFDHSRTLAERDREFADLRLAYGGLRAELRQSETRFRAVTQALEAKHAYLVAMVEGTRSRAARALRAQAPKASEDGRARIETSRIAVLKQLGELELMMQGPRAELASIAAGGLRAEVSARRPSADRARLEAERRRLMGRAQDLEARLVRLDDSQKGVMDDIFTGTIDRIKKVRTLIAGTGLDVDRLLAPISGGKGGPFVAAAVGTGTSAEARLDRLDHHMARWEDMRQLLSELPLAAPSRHFYVSSKFGRRRDPVNRRLSMHHGVDLAGVYRSPVLATAPGVVTYAGWHGGFGRMIEIDHGGGIRTRYGHLRRITVKRGRKVAFRQKIGQMGNSGRSTGPHIHYEVLVNGKPRDPMKFIKAGEHVYKGF